MKRKKSNITLFAILTTLAILTWVSVEAYLILNKLHLESVPESILLPLDPSLDSDTLSNLENRAIYSEATASGNQQ